MNKENCALKLVDEIILIKKLKFIHKMTADIINFVVAAQNQFFAATTYFVIPVHASKLTNVWQFPEDYPDKQKRVFISDGFGVKM